MYNKMHRTTELENIINTKTLDTKTCRLAKHLLKNLNKHSISTAPTSLYKYPVVKEKEEVTYIWLEELIPEDSAFKKCIYNTQKLWWLVWDLSCVFYKQQHTKKGKPVDTAFQKLMHRLRNLAFEDSDSGQTEYASVDGICIYPDGPLECNKCGEEFYMEKYLDLHKCEEHCKPMAGG